MISFSHPISDRNMKTQFYGTSYFSAIENHFGKYFQQVKLWGYALFSVVCKTKKKVKFNTLFSRFLLRLRKKCWNLYANVSDFEKTKENYLIIHVLKIFMQIILKTYIKIVFSNLFWRCFWFFLEEKEEEKKTMTLTF